MYGLKETKLLAAGELRCFVLGGHAWLGTLCLVVVLVVRATQHLPCFAQSLAFTTLRVCGQYCQTKSLNLNSTLSLKVQKLRWKTLNVCKIINCQSFISALWFCFQTYKMACPGSCDINTCVHVSFVLLGCAVLKRAVSLFCFPFVSGEC